MDEQQLEQIEGVVEDIIYENEDNGYVVFEISGGGVLTVVCGIVGELHAGESVICRGRYENHATYGRQFHAQECETDMPKDLEAVYAFLASRSLPYIGARTADKIIDMFGAEALEVIANDPARLTRIPGISPDKADRIQQEFKRMFGMRELIAYLAQFEISPRRAMEVFRVFGPSAMQAISQNPYLLCGEPLQLDFRHADSIAQYYHMEGDCAQRLEAALLRTLRHNAGNGHTCLPRAQLLATASNFIHQPPEKLARALDHCIETEELCVKMFDAVPYIYLPDLLAAEQDIADRLNLLAKRGKNTARDLDKNIQILELTQGFAYAPLQREAIRKAMTENCLVLTGGPGTGKTLIQRFLLDIYRRKNRGAKIICCAPTGRAARRMEQSTGFPATTIHKALGLLAGEDGDYCEPEMLDADLIVVDEVSMMDIYLANHLFRSVPHGSQLVLIGDADQLPSVGPGAVLSEIIACGAVPVVRLDRIFRQSYGSRIAANAKLIRHGNLSLEYGEDFQFYDSCDMSASAQQIETLYLQETARYGVDNVALLTPYRQKTETGVNALNERLREKLNPQDGKKPEVVYRKRIYRLGDKVMQIKNCEDISNGDIGYITSVTRDDTDSVLTVDFGDGRIAEYDGSDLEMLDLAYASTIHKSQGSEYKSVIINLQCAHAVMLVRPLVYTAITRAKERVLIVGERRALCIAIKRNGNLAQ